MQGTLFLKGSFCIHTVARQLVNSCRTRPTLAFSDLKKIINRIWEHFRSNPKKYFFRVAIAFFVIWSLFDDYGLVKRVRMEADHRQLIDRLKVEQQKIVANELRIQHAHDPDSIEKAAREKYNFRKPGETLFIINDVKDK